MQNPFHLAFPIRDIEETKSFYKKHFNCKIGRQDKKWVDGLMETNDLLKLCGELPTTKFIIFTNLEDTPITDDIHDKIPENVVAIYGVNAIGFGGKVHPFPYGVQRIIHSSDNRIGILQKYMEKTVKPKKLLY